MLVKYYQYLSTENQMKYLNLKEMKIVHNTDLRMNGLYNYYQETKVQGNIMFIYLEMENFQQHLLNKTYIQSNV